jgi:hypothetical protein
MRITQPNGRIEDRPYETKPMYLPGERWAQPACKTGAAVRNKANSASAR